MQPWSVFSKSPVNALSYFHNLKTKKKKKKGYELLALIYEDTDFSTLWI